MKIIGLIGGLTWFSTLDYYRLLNEMVNEKKGGAAAAEIIIYSVNFEIIKVLTEENRWDEIAKIMGIVAKKIEAAGADCILIGANTMHKVADEIQKEVRIPILHVAKKVAEEINKQQLTTVALLGTKYTMQQGFYTEKLSQQGINTIVPNEEEIEFINNAIYTEMGKGIFLQETKTNFLTIINRLISQGAQGIILGCTEIPILIKQKDCPVPVFDTTRIHAAAAVAFALV